MYEAITLNCRRINPHLSFVVIILYKNTRNLTHRSYCLLSILPSVAGPYTPTPVSFGRKLLNRGRGGVK